MMTGSLRTMYDDWELLKATPVTTGDGFGWPAEARPAIAAAAVRNSTMRRQAARALHAMAGQIRQQRQVALPASRVPI
eukprot:COSAG06_NODE_85_length_25072_cov_62.049453_10_plen_78_part_00